jgi:polyisoprenoid-binding protein YceI
MTPAKGDYLIDTERSGISFRTRAIFGLLGVRGMFRVGHGKISVADRVEDSTVEAVIPAGSFYSANASRDEHVCSSDFLDVGTYPEIVFTGDRVCGGDRGRTATLSGKLTVRGVTRPVGLVLHRVDCDGETLTARASTRVDRYAFGVTGRYLTLTLDIVAKR